MMDPLPNVKQDKIKLVEINEYITCKLCKGYFIDATTISECLHSFCRSCIIQFLQENSHCPICEMIINKAKPNIKLDKTLQDIVYKLVPELFINEMARRQRFYKSRPEEKAKTTPEERGVDTERTIFNPRDAISLSIEYISDDSTPGAISVPEAKYNPSQPQESQMKRFLQCPGNCRIEVLKKFVQNKYSVDVGSFHIEILYKRVPLPNHYTLIDIAYIYSWKRNEPMKFFFRILDKVLIEKAANCIHFDHIFVKPPKSNREYSKRKPPVNNNILNESDQNKNVSESTNNDRKSDENFYQKICKKSLTLIKLPQNNEIDKNLICFDDISKIVETTFKIGDDTLKFDKNESQMRVKKGKKEKRSQKIKNFDVAENFFVKTIEDKLNDVKLVKIEDDLETKENENDSKIIKNESKMIKIESKMINNEGKMIQNEGEMIRDEVKIQNESKVGLSELRVDQNGSKFGQNESKVDQNGIRLTQNGIRLTQSESKLLQNELKESKIDQNGVKLFLSGSKLIQNELKVDQPDSKSLQPKSKLILSVSESKLHQSESKLNQLDSKSNQPKSKLIISMSKESKLHQIDSKLGQADSKLGQTDSNVGQTDSKLHQSDSKLGQIYSKLGQTDSKLHQSDSKPHHPESEVDKIDSKLHQSKSKLIPSMSKESKMCQNGTKLNQPESKLILNDSKMCQNDSKLLQAESKFILSTSNESKVCQNDSKLLQSESKLILNVSNGSKVCQNDSKLPKSDSKLLLSTSNESKVCQNDSKLTQNELRDLKESRDNKDEINVTQRDAKLCQLESRLIQNDSKCLIIDQNELKVDQNDLRLLQSQSKLSQTDSKLLQTESKLIPIMSKLCQNESKTVRDESKIESSKLLQNEASRMCQNEPKLIQNESNLIQNDSKLGQDESKLIQNVSNLVQIESKLSNMKQNDSKVDENVTKTCQNEIKDGLKSESDVKVETSDVKIDHYDFEIEEMREKNDLGCYKSKKSKIDEKCEFFKSIELKQIVDLVKKNEEVVKTVQKRKNPSPLKNEAGLSSKRVKRKTNPPQKIILNTQNSPKKPNDDLKEIFSHCKFNIPSSLSITLKETSLDDEGRGNLKLEPVKNFIEILKIPDQKESNQNEFKSSQNEFKSSQNEFKSSQNEFKSNQNEFKSNQNEFKSNQNDLKSKSAPNLCQTSKPIYQAIKRALDSPNRAVSKKGRFDFGKFQSSPNLMKFEQNVAKLHSASLNLNYTVSVNQNVMRHFGKLDPKFESFKQKKKSPIKTESDVKDEDCVQLSPHKIELLKKNGKNSPPSNKKPQIVPILPKPAILDSGLIQNNLNLNNLSTNQLMEKYNIQNLAQLTASLHFNPMLNVNPSPVVLQQAILKQFEMQNRQNWQLSQFQTNNKYLSATNLNTNRLVTKEN